MPENSLPPNLVLMQMAGNFRISQILFATARLGLADLVKDTPKSLDELAVACGASPAALYRLLRALLSLGILAQDQEGRFTLTPKGVYLQTDHPSSVRPYILFMAGQVNWESWGNFIHSVTTGGTAIKYTFGLELFDYISQNPEFGEIFDNGMAGMTASMTKALLATYDFSKFKQVVDIGGGNGALLIALLKAHPTLQGVLFDLPLVASKATPLLMAPELGERLRVEEGDFFKSVPSGGDVYILKYILHDWDDAKAIKILKNCYQAMEPRAKLLVLDVILPELENITDTENEASIGKFIYDLQMLTLTGGQERTEREFKQLFIEAGFSLTQVISLPLSGNLSIIEGIKKEVELKPCGLE